MTENSVCSVCGSNIINGRCVRFTQHPYKKPKGRKFIGHVVRADPHEGKEDTRPRERKGKKKKVSMAWEKLKGAF